MPAKTARERQTDFRKRMKAEGKKELRLWVREDRVEEAKEAIARINNDQPDERERTEK